MSPSASPTVDRIAVSNRHRLYRVATDERIRHVRFGQPDPDMPSSGVATTAPLTEGEPADQPADLSLAVKSPSGTLDLEAPTARVVAQHQPIASLTGAGCEVYDGYQHQYQGLRVRLADEVWTLDPTVVRDTLRALLVDQFAFPNPIPTQADEIISRVIDQRYGSFTLGVWDHDVDHEGLFSDHAVKMTLGLASTYQASRETLEALETYPFHLRELSLSPQ